MKYLARDLGLAVLALALVHACGGGGDTPSGTSLSLPTPAGVVLADRCGAPFDLLALRPRDLEAMEKILRR